MNRVINHIAARPTLILWLLLATAVWVGAWEQSL